MTLIWRISKSIWNELSSGHAYGAWFLSGDSKLPEAHKEIIKDLDNSCFISIASIWEIAIKVSLKKLNLDFKFNRLSTVLANNSIDILPIYFEHLIQLSELKFHHRDPFDRVIICQAIAEKMTILTSDEHIKAYPVKAI